MSPKPYTHRDAVPYRLIDWTGLYPPEFPAGSVPNHVAIVMDGNGRWANRQGLTRVEGHKAGEAALLDVVAGAIQAGVKHLSVYAFSTENWSRSPDEVRFLMGFNRDVLHRRRDQLNEWGVDKNVVALVFDTTSSNSGVHRGATVRLQKALGRPGPPLRRSYY